MGDKSKLLSRIFRRPGCQQQGWAVDKRRQDAVAHTDIADFKARLKCVNCCKGSDGDMICRGNLIILCPEQVQ